jgi:hypothetical protein
MTPSGFHLCLSPWVDTTRVGDKSQCILFIFFHMGNGPVTGGELNFIGTEVMIDRRKTGCLFLPRERT